MVFTKSKPIWISEKLNKDEYADFYTTLNYEGGKAEINVSADSDYVLYINGKVVSFGAYHGYRDLQFYDNIDITSKLKKGENIIAFTVWHYGEGNFYHIDVENGLIFEILVDGKVLSSSDEKVLSRKSLTYESGKEQLITMQLGFSYSYNAKGEDGFQKSVTEGFNKSKVLSVKTEYSLRPVKKLLLKNKVEGRLIKEEGNRKLYDLGKEYVGFLFLKVKASKGGEVKVYYGEHIADGWTRSVFPNGYSGGKREFSVIYNAKRGNNSFTGYFKRFGCRYLEIVSEEGVTVQEIALIPTEYPIAEKKYDFKDEKLNKIYEISLRTLKACMHEHYEDCPWREQALYVMDSRNQMLCGYYAFKKPQEFIKSNLMLMAKGQRQNGQLDICFPCENELFIPSFSLHLLTSVKEYLFYTKDKEYVTELLPVLKRIIDGFLNNMKDGLAIPFIGEGAWNFYEWKEGYDGCNNDTPDLILNALLSFAIKNYSDICKKLKVENGYLAVGKKLNRNIAKAFFDKKTGLFRNYPQEDCNMYSELGNSLAVLCGAVKYVNDGEKALKVISQKLKDDNSVMTKVTLSMKCFKYDALLLDGSEENKEYVLRTLRKDYSYMLDNGATTFWETLEGEKDFDGQASLCHGWSAMPVYYFNKLLK